jgi:hypothetical protein
MDTNDRPARVTRNGWKLEVRAVCGIALVSFAAGSVIAARAAPEKQPKADGNRVFELNVYHAVPGKVQALEARFRDGSKLLAKHGLDLVGFWVPNGDPAWANTFVYIVAGASQKELEKNWDAVHADPAFEEYRKAEKAEKLIEKVDSTFMRPTDFSALK